MPAITRGAPLLVSNALDAAGRVTLDLAVDVLAVAALGASAAQMGLLNALGTLAFLLLGIPIGVIVDRSPHVRAIFSSGLLRSGVFASLFLAWHLGALEIWHLYLAAVVTGMTTVVTETAQTAMTPRVSGASGVSRLVSAMQSAESVIGLVVPAAAGVAITGLGAGPIVGISAALTATAALTILRQQVAPVEPGAPDRVEAAAASQADRGALAPFIREAREGWATLRGERTLWRVTLAAVTVNLGLAVHSAIEVVLILRTLRLGESTLGFVVSAGAAGALVGSVIAVPLARRFTAQVVVRVSAGGLPVAACATLVALLDAPRGAIWLVIGAFAWGLCIVCFNILLAGIAAELTPARLLGRVAATRRTLTMGIVPAGSLAGGFVGDFAGVGSAVGIWVLLAALATFITGTAFADGG